MSPNEALSIVTAGAVLLGALILGQDPEPAPALASLDGELAALAERITPSIVTVSAFAPEGDEPLPPPGRSSWSRAHGEDYPGFRRVGAGSGVMVGAAGEVLTNRHHLLGPDGELADLIDVETADNRHTLARIVGVEPTLDLALLRLDFYPTHNPPSFEVVELGPSEDLAPGRMAIVAGDPFGPERFFAHGTVSALPNRLCYQEQRSATYLQIAIEAPPGVHGGGVFDVAGRMVGLWTPRDPEALAEGSMPGLGFALPSSILAGLIEAMRAGEVMESPWLGFAVMGMPELRNEMGTQAFAAFNRPRSGIYVENVFTPSPAAAAGVRVGDFITHIDGHTLGSPLDFQKILYVAGIGSELTLRLFREGEVLEVDVTVKSRPEEARPR